MRHAAWSHAKLQTPTGASCLAAKYPGLPLDLNELPDGTEFSVVASTLAGGKFGPYAELLRFARPRSGTLGVDVRWDGTAFVALSAAAPTEWRLARVAADGSPRARPVSFTVDAQASRGTVHVLRNGYLVTWAQGPDDILGVAGGAQRIRCR